MTVKGFGTGMVVPTQGDVTIRSGTWSNVTDFFVAPPQFEPGRQGDNRDVLISVDFEPHPMAGPTALNVKLAGAEALDGQLSMHNEEDAHRLILVPDRIVLESNRHERQRLYFAEQAPGFIPTNSEIISPEAYGGYLEDILGQSNQDLMDALGLSFAGALLPDDAHTQRGRGRLWWACHARAYLFRHVCSSTRPRHLQTSLTVLTSMPAGRPRAAWLEPWRPLIINKTVVDIVLGSQRLMFFGVRDGCRICLLSCR